MGTEGRTNLTAEAVKRIVGHCNVETFEKYLAQIPFPSQTLPQTIEDISEMQLEDMLEKLVALREDEEKFPHGFAEKEEANYRRISEACVKYSIALDRINVIGREEMRDRRKKMLMEIDQISNRIVDKYEEFTTSKKNSTSS